MAVELSEKELADLRAKADAADKAAEREAALTKKHQESESALAASRKKYDDDMRQVASYLQQQNQAPPASQQDDDPDAIVSQKDLRRASEETARRTQESQNQHTTLLLRNQRNINKQLAVQRLGPKAEKYLSEIDAHLDRLDPAVAAQPTAYDEVFKYVRAAHIDEELEEARSQRESDSDEGEESQERSSSESPPARAITRTESVSPGSGISASRPITRSQMQKPRLTDEQRRVAAGFEMSDEQYAGEYATDEVLVNADPYGFRDKNGRMRKRV